MQSQSEGRRFLNPSILARIGNLELIAKFVVEGFISGLHKSPYHGFSVEFAQYRQYMPGDDTKHIDWKAYARTDRYYIKQFEEETNLNCYLLLDTSESMSHPVDDVPEGDDYGSDLEETAIFQFPHRLPCLFYGEAAGRYRVRLF